MSKHAQPDDDMLATNLISTHYRFMLLEKRIAKGTAVYNENTGIRSECCKYSFFFKIEGLSLFFTADFCCENRKEKNIS